MTADVQTLLTSGAALADDALERLLPAATVEPHSIHRAMRHSTFAGGKRLRPILCMEAARCVAHELPAGAPELGAAIEFVHTYSLIHDDLPALDNDDLRRGKPTCHVAFGEAIAILAGDALQTLSFQTIAALPTASPTVVQILREFSIAIGTGVGPLPGSTTAQNLPPGMIGGQVMDIEGERHKPTPELVERIHRAKTGALITTSIVCGGFLGLGHCLASPDGQKRLACTAEDVIRRLRTFGENAGLAFQIVDDVLDMTQSSAQLGKTAGKDTATEKATWPAVFGIQRSRADAATLIRDAFAALEPFGNAADPLKSLALYLVERTH
ncbi:MAG TPA: farnesyl diphosphate synthase [Acidobacteriaceae bacterium]|nr:farnesyl diphosphate synthase [Acidobacteriaceae bacterium]